MRIKRDFLLKQLFLSIFFLWINTCFSSIQALTEIKLINKASPVIQEVYAAYSPGRSESPSTSPTVVIPFERSMATFGGLTSDIPEAVNLSSAKKEDSINTPSIHLVSHYISSSLKARPICGPSPQTNTLNCFDLASNGFYLGSFPSPGMLSAAPIFHDGYWLFATTKGFLFKVKSDPENKNLPKLSGTNAFLWGRYSRDVMASFRFKTLYNDNILNDKNNNQILTTNMEWIFPTSAAFIGTPVVFNNVIYIFSTSQYLQSFDWTTGKLLWAVRLAPDTSLHLASNSLFVTSSEIIVGNSLGTLLVLNPADGSILWEWQVPEASIEQKIAAKIPTHPDRFQGLVAKPALNNHYLIISNAESMTQCISLESKSLIWNYPAGSVTQSKFISNNSLILGTNTGKVVNLDLGTGRVKWSISVTNKSPIFSLFITKEQQILAATSLGQIFLIDSHSGKILAKNNSIGSVNGDFFLGYNDADVCLSFAMEGFRCFRVRS